MWRHAVHVDSALRQERAGIVYLVDAPRLDLDIGEAGRLELRRVLCFLQRPGDAADPKLHAPPDIRGDLTADHDVGHREPAARLQHTKRFAQHCVLVTRQVDHAVRDDHVDRIVGERDVLDRPFQELYVGCAGLALVLARQREHLVGHVETEGLPRRADPLRGQENVDATAGTEVEYRLARLQGNQRGRISATERRGDRVCR